MKRKIKQGSEKLDDLYSRPNVTLFSRKEWGYLQKRYQISPRELDVAKLICKGLNKKEVAEKLNICPGTVQIHLRNVYRRIRVRNKILMILRFAADVKNLSCSTKAPKL